jgi:hypothetical protein
MPVSSRVTCTTIVTLLCLVPFAVQAALPSVGQPVGASAEELTVAMALAGCPLQAMAVEQGKVAATCQDAAGEAWKVVIDPTTGRVTEVAPIAAHPAP